MINIIGFNDDEERKRCAKEFAEILSKRLSAKEIAMSLWENECLVCIFREDCMGNVPIETCVTGVITYANNKFYGGGEDEANN